MNTKGQLSIEFIVMMSTAIALVIVFLYVGNDLFFEKTEYSQNVALRDLGYTIQSEIILAAKSEPGYSRNFSIPSTVEHMNFTLKSTNSSFYIMYKNNIFTYFIPEISGNVSKGKNIIHTNQTTIIIRQVP
jgi:hypothetical protein